MYREMTAEEKLAYSSELLESIKTNGLLGSLDVVEKYKKILSQNTTVEPQLQEETIVHASSYIKEMNPQKASIYAAEHIPAVQEDLREQKSANIENEEQPVEQPKTRVLEQNKSSAPNPWGESKVVLPGELDL